MFKGPTSTTDYGIYLKGTHDKVRLYYSSNGVRFFPAFDSIPPMDDNNWHTLLAVFDREKQTLYVYIDGVQLAGEFNMIGREPTDDPKVMSLHCKLIN